MMNPPAHWTPISTSRIEDLMGELKEKYTIVIVTHNMQQAGRISHDGVFSTGNVEYDTTDQIFPSLRIADGRLCTGRFGCEGGVTYHALRGRFDKELSGLTADLMDVASMVSGVIRKTSDGAGTI